MARSLRERALWLNRAIDMRKGTLPVAISRFYNRHLRDTTRTVETRVQDADDHWEANKVGDALCCGGPHVDPTRWRLARVMKLSAFVIYNTNKPIGEYSVQQYRAWLQLHPSEARACQRGSLKGTRNHFWLTKADDLERELAQIQPSDSADVARAVLGLRVGRGVDLVCLMFSPPYFRQLWIPTFVDGGANELFCTWLDEAEGLGYTWCLATDHRGLPELVGQDEDLTERAEVVYLGRTLQRQPRVRYKRRLGRLHAQ